MKNFFQLFVLAVVAAAFVATGCGEDETPIFDTPPSIDFADSHPNGLNGPYPTTDVEVTDVDQWVYVVLEAVAGTGNINSITVTEDDVKVATDRLSFRDLTADADITANNPLLVVGDNAAGFSIEIGINPHDDIAAKTYAFEVGADDGQTSTVTFTITTIDPGTPVSTVLEGVLLNQAGPAGQGGLDLDDGSSTGTVIDASAADAEIKDEGIDVSLPNDQNWKAQISAINDAEMRIPGAGFPEDFDFANVATVEEIQGYFDGGEQLPNYDADDDEYISDAVEVGDVFLVTRNGVYYLLQVTAVNPTPADNADNIVFDIVF